MGLVFTRQPTLTSQHIYGGVPAPYAISYKNKPRHSASAGSHAGAERGDMPWRGRHKAPLETLDQRTKE